MSAMLACADGMPPQGKEFASARDFEFPRHHNSIDSGGLSMLGKAAASLLAIACAGGAMAQTADMHDGERGNGAPAANGPTSLEEVIVTAQRRSERLVDVPISIATVSSDDLERAGPMSLESLNRVVPGIYMQRDIYGLSPTIRGIGSTLASSGGESNVAVYVDDVYLPYKATNIFDVANIANVQVLKGPQGTLFGRNATGGAILVSTLDPSFDPQARLKVSYERFGQARASGYANVPITDSLAANAAVTYRHSDGYIRDNRTGALVNEAEESSARVKLLFEPTSTLSIVLGGYHSEFDDPTGASYQTVQTVPFYNLPGIDANAGPIATDRFHLSHNHAPLVETESDQYTAHIGWETGAGTLKSITSYQKSQLLSVNDLDATYQDLVPAADAFVDLKTDSRVFTQEVNFTSKPGSTLEYVAGVFYYRATTGAPYLLISGIPNFKTVGRTEATSAYFDATYRLGKWALIGGLRHTHETRSINTQFFPSGTNIGEETEKVWTPRAGVRYELSPSSNVYAIYTRGYKAGIFDATSPLGNKVDPEYVDSYEVGYKASTANATLNAAVYYYDFTDTQVNALFSSGTAVFQQLFNVPQSRIHGVDLDGTYRFNDTWDVRASVAYTHATYEDFVNAPGYVLDPTDPATSFGLFQSSVSVDVSGNRMVRAPDWSASAAVNYHANLGSAARLDMSLSGMYTSRVHFDFENHLSQPAYVLVDANATVTFHERLAVSIFGRNLTDKIYYTGLSESALSLMTGVYGMPRTYGVSVGYSF